MTTLNPQTEIKTERTLTLLDVATLAGSTKRTAQRWLEKATAEHGEIGELVEGTRLFSNAEKDILLGYKSKRPQNSVAQDLQAIEPETQVYQPTVIPGNGRGQLDAPIVPQTFDLSQFRTRGTLSTDLSTAADAMAAVRAIRQSLRQDLEQQWQQLETTQATEKAVTAELQALERDASEYRVTSDILSRLQSQSAQGLQQRLGEVSSLGKPIAPGGAATES